MPSSLSSSMSTQPVPLARAVVIESSTLVRRGIVALLDAANIDCVGVTRSASEGHRLVAELEVDLVIIGSCQDSAHLNLVARLQSSSGLKSVVITPVNDLLAVFALYKAGAIAVVSPTATEDEFIEMLAIVLSGQRYVPAHLLVEALDKPTRASQQQQTFDLTNREKEVLAELAMGRTNREIADRLCIGVETVKSHLNNIYSKFSVSRRSQAVSIAIRHSLL
jgi:DNA-binding NarL/FixJ family response regulator